MSGMRITLFVTPNSDTLAYEFAASGTGIVAVKLISSSSEAQVLFFLSWQASVLTAAILGMLSLSRDRAGESAEGEIQVS